MVGEVLHLRDGVDEVVDVEGAGLVAVVALAAGAGDRAAGGDDLDARLSRGRLSVLCAGGGGAANRMQVIIPKRTMRSQFDRCMVFSVISS